MFKKKIFIFLIPCLLWSSTAFGQAYPRLQNFPPKVNILGQMVVDPGHPMAFSRQNGNPGLYPLYPMSALINLGLSTEDNNIQSSLIFGGFKFLDNFFLGFDAGGLILPENLKYDLLLHKYVTSINDANLGYWGDVIFGYQVIPGLALGIKGGFFSEDLVSGEASGLNANMGFVWHHFFSNFTVASHYRNLGSDIALLDTTIAQASVLNFSLSFDHQFGDFYIYPQATMEYADYEGSQIGASLGISWQKILTLQLAGTFMGEINYFPWSVGLQGRLSHIDLNYSVAGTNDEGLFHQVGFSWHIGDLKDAEDIGPAIPGKKQRKYYKGVIQPPAPVVLDTAYSQSPTPPRNVRLKEDEDRVVLEWDPVALGDTYLVYAKLGEKSVFRKVTPKAISEFRFTFKKPSGDIILFLYVKTVRKDFVSNPSRVVSFARE